MRSKLIIAVIRSKVDANIFPAVLIMESCCFLVMQITYTKYTRNVLIRQLESGAGKRVGEERKER